MEFWKCRPKLKNHGKWHENDINSSWYTWKSNGSSDATSTAEVFGPFLFASQVSDWCDDLFYLFLKLSLFERAQTDGRTTFFWIKADFVVRLLNFKSRLHEKPHAKFVKKSSMVFQLILFSVMYLLFFLNVHNAMLNVRYIVFTHTKRYQCAFVCTPIFCIITLSHYLRKIEYVVHSILEF